MSEYDSDDKKTLHCQACGVVSDVERWSTWPAYYEKPAGEEIVKGKVTLAACPTCGTVRAL